MHAGAFVFLARNGKAVMTRVETGISDATHVVIVTGVKAGDPVINDHLGDAYWRAGRRVEAQFQWRRVLTLEPEGQLRAPHVPFPEAILETTSD